MSVDEDVFSRCYTYTLRGQTYVADPFRIRRSLLESTSGRAWSAIQTYKDLATEIAKLETALEDTEADLLHNPLSTEERNPPPPVEGEPSRPQTRLEHKEYLVAQLSVHSLSYVRYEAGLAHAAYAAFELQPFNPEDRTGILESEILDLLAAFVEWAEKKGERFGG